MPSDTTPTRTPVPSSAELRAHGVGVQNRIAFAEYVAGAGARVRRQADRIDDGKLGDGGEPGHRQARLNAAARGVPDFDGHAGIGQLADVLVGDRGHQDVDLHLVVRVDAQAAALHRVVAPNAGAALSVVSASSDPDRLTRSARTVVSLLVAAVASVCWASVVAAKSGKARRDEQSVSHHGFSHTRTRVKWTDPLDAIKMTKLWQWQSLQQKCERAFEAPGPRRFGMTGAGIFHVAE